MTSSTADPKTAMWAAVLASLIFYAILSASIVLMIILKFLGEKCCTGEEGDEPSKPKFKPEKSAGTKPTVSSKRSGSTMQFGAMRIG